MKSSKSFLHYLNGLLIRTIIAGVLFALLFIGSVMSVKIYDYNIQKLANIVENDTFVTNIQKKVQAIFD